MAALIVRDGPGEGNRLEVEDELILGRESQEALQHDGEVSRRHAAVRPGAGGLEIEDLGSSNGTFVNEERISAPTPVGPGDVIRVGQTSLEVEATPATAGTVIREVPESAPPADAAAVPPAAEPPSDVTAPLDAGPGPVPAGPPAGPPPLGPPPAGPPPAAPYVGAPPGYRPRSGSAGAATVLFILAAIGLLWGGFDLYRYVSDLDIVGLFGLKTTFFILIGCMAAVILGAILAIPGGIGLLRGRGKSLGIVAGMLAALGAGATLVVWVVQLDASADIVTWAGMVITLILGIVAIFLSAASRTAARPY